MPDTSESRHVPSSESWGAARDGNAKKRWSVAKAAEIDNAMASGSSSAAAWLGIKALIAMRKGRQPISEQKLLAADGTTVLTSQEDIIARWQQHFSPLFEMEGISDSTAERDSAGAEST